MHLRHLLQQRDDLLRQTRLANAAFAYHRLSEFAQRIARVRLAGAVALRLGDDERPWPGLVALEGSQAVIQEHFLDEEIVELADILAFLGEVPDGRGVTLRLEELAARFLLPLRRELEAAGVALDEAARETKESPGRPG